ncbi:MAG: hypothetical protein SNJ57_16160 [Cyanobacteriota bacterium]
MEINSRNLEQPAAAEAAEDFAKTPVPQFNQIILKGAPEWVRGMMYRLHHEGVLNIGEWSRLLPTGRPDEVMTLSQQHRRAR